MDKDTPTLAASTPLREFSALIACDDPSIGRRQGMMLVDAEKRFVGIITRSDVVRALERHPQGNPSVLEAGSRELVTVYADETLHDAIAKMLKHDHGRLPVVDRSDEKKIVGYLGRAGILAARQNYYDEEEIRGRGFGLDGVPAVETAA
jgi:chloride channel protein, CIC family